MGKRKRKSESQKLRDDRERKRLQRENPLFRSDEQTRDASSRRSARQIPEVRGTEQARNTTARRSTRTNPEIRQREQVMNTQARRSSRLNPEVKEKEQARDTSARRVIREISPIRDEEQARNTAARRSTRTNPEVRQKEQVMDTQARRSSRLNPEVREKEQAMDTSARRSTRENQERREREQDLDTSARQKKRANLTVKSAEQEQNTASKRAKRDSTHKPFDVLSQEFQEKKWSAPSVICSCCGLLGYEDARITITPTSKLGNLSEDLSSKIYSYNQTPEKLCRTCASAARSGKVPKLALYNGFRFPNQPMELKRLTSLEERLVALRIPFMCIRLLGTERQSTLRGCVVNIENDLDVVANVLPRRFEDTSIVQVKLMRRMTDRSPYMYEKIRPLAVYEAAKYLMNTPAYKEENVDLSDAWANHCEDDIIDFVIDRVEESDGPREETSNESAEENPEDMPNITAEQTVIFSDKQTLYTVPGITIAPGEGNTPIPFYEDLRAEELSFPKIYCGQLRKYSEDIKVSYTDINRSELKMFDRRACTVEHLLYAACKSRVEKIFDALQICLRKTLGNNALTAGDVRQPETLNRLICKDEGYSVFKNIRSSPPFWQQKKKHATAMVRQLGTPQLFVTLSAAETKWTELAIMLKKILHNEDISKQDAAQIPYTVICEMIRSDPVTCMTHFDHRFRALLTHLILKKNGVFEPYDVIDYFTRVEFQMRGSPHIHGLYWLKDAPVYDENKPESHVQCVKFIDALITCERDESGEMEKLIAYQLHNHSPTCYKNQKNKSNCRFGFPKPPMDNTCILQPLSLDTDGEKLKKARANYRIIHLKLVEMSKTFRQIIPFPDFVASLNLTEEEYITAIQSSIKRVTTFLKRKTDAIYINQYNSRLLREWEANVDVQFVTDAYACARYCVGYILKSESGVSKLLKAAADDAKKAIFR